MKNPIFEALFEKNALFAYSWNLADIAWKVGLVGALFSIFSTTTIILSFLAVSLVAFILKIVIFKLSGLDPALLKNKEGHVARDESND